MKKLITPILFLLSVIITYAQPTPITLISEDFEIKSNQNDAFYIRAYKGDILHIKIQTEIKNEKKEKYYELNNVKIYRQNADDFFQHIVDKNDVSNLDINITVPSNGIYTMTVDRGGMRNFKTNILVERKPENEQTARMDYKAVLVSIPDTVHTYLKDSVIYDYIRTSTPFTKKQRTPQYKEDQIFMDVSYALRINNIYTIPIQIPFEIMTDYKIAKSTKWGFMISVSDEVYKALKKKVASVATAAIDAGIGKAMSGKTDELGNVTKNTLQKGYDVFDKASTANSIAGITGDAASIEGNKKLVVASDVVQTITGFTGLTEVAGEKIASFVPKVSDEVKFKILNTPQYRSYIKGEKYEVMQSGKGSYASGEFEIKNPNDVYYIIIENGRSTGGDFFDVAKNIGKTVLSQYVYTNIKVFVQRKVEVTYDKGYFETDLIPVYNPKWWHKSDISAKNVIIFEDEVKPFYRKLNTPKIY